MPKNFRNKRAFSYVQICVLVLVLCFMLTVFLAVVYAVNSVRLMEKNAHTVLESYVMANAVEIYNSIKQGSDETSTLDSSKYIGELKDFCALHDQRPYLYHYGEDNRYDYYISQPTVSFSEIGKLRIQVSFTVYVPMYFAGVKVATAAVPVTVRTNLEGKF